MTLPPALRATDDDDRPCAGSRFDLAIRYGIALATIAIVLGVLADRLVGMPGAMRVAEAGVCLYVVGVLLAPNARDLLFVGLAAAGLLAVWIGADDPVAVTARSLDLAAFLMAFLATLGFLRDAAATSPLVGRAGHDLVEQPPGRRYAALSLGGFLVGVILSYGVVTLLGAMIMRGVAQTEPSLRPIREQRMLSALLRGFSVLTMWAPTSVTMALILALLPSLTWARQLPVGMGLVVLLLVLGWLLDRWRWRRPLRLPVQSEESDHGPILGMIALVAAVLACVILLSVLVTGDLVVAAMVTGPLFGIVWIAWQQVDRGRGGALSAFGQRLRTIFTQSLPASRGEIIVLGSSGVIGTCVTALVPVGDVVAGLNGLGLPALAVLAALSASVILAAHLGINPLVSITLWGSATQYGLLEGTHPSLIGVALAAGWSLALNTGPACASMVILSRLTGRTMTEVGLRWNGWYVLAGWVITVAYVGLLDAVWL